MPFCVARTGHHATVLRDAWSVDGRTVRGADVPSLIKTRIANGLRWSAFESQAGPVVMFVTNEERAMVVVLDEPGDAGSHAMDPDAGPGTSGGFVLDNGQHDEYADRDTVPFEAGVAAVTHIIENGELDPRITWHSDR